MLKGHLPRVIYHRVYMSIRRQTGVLDRSRRPRTGAAATGRACEKAGHAPPRRCMAGWRRGAPPLLPGQPAIQRERERERETARGSEEGR